MDIPPGKPAPSQGAESLPKQGDKPDDSHDQGSAQWQRHTLESTSAKKTLTDETVSLHTESTDVVQSGGKKRSVSQTEASGGTDDKITECEELLTQLLDDIETGIITPLVLTEPMMQACLKKQVKKEHQSAKRAEVQVRMSQLGNHLMKFSQQSKDQKAVARKVMLAVMKQAFTLDSDLCLGRLECWFAQARLTQAGSMDLLERQYFVNQLSAQESLGIPMSEWLLGIIKMGLVKHMEPFVAPGYGFCHLERARQWYLLCDYGDPVRFSYNELIASDVDRVMPETPGYEETEFNRVVLVLAVKKICEVATVNKDLNISNSTLSHLMHEFSKIMFDLKHHYLQGGQSHSSSAETRTQIEKMSRMSDPVMRRLGCCLLYLMNNSGMGGAKNLMAAAEASFKAAEDGFTPMYLLAAERYIACGSFQRAERSLSQFLNCTTKLSEGTQTKVNLIKDRISNGTEKAQVELDKWLTEFGYSSDSQEHSSKSSRKKKRRKKKKEGDDQGEKQIEEKDLPSTSESVTPNVQKKVTEPTEEVIRGATALVEQTPKVASAKSTSVEPRDYRLLCSRFWDRSLKKTVRDAKKLKEDGYPDKAAIKLKPVIESSPIGVERALEEYAFCKMDVTHIGASSHPEVLLDEAEWALVRMFKYKTGVVLRTPADAFRVKRLLDQILIDCKPRVSDQEFWEIRAGFICTMSALGHLYSLKYGYCASAGSEKYRDFYELRNKLYQG